ncbi:MAG: hypothetical protein CEE38_14440 [Planctomycetes bacterium B3_Pla]|nr:MAG: hypothetical protein CEE38_14440 [Planctomycetes bacterium B3_Pla]
MEKEKSQIDGFPEIMVQSELIEYLRIPEVSKADNYDNVVGNLKRMHDLPCIHICKQPLYPIDAVRRWVEEKAEKEQRK